MPSGAKKRKAAKKKKVNDSSTANPHQIENDGGEVSSTTSLDPIVEAEKREDDNSSENKLNEANVEIEKGSKSKSSHSSSSSSSDSSDDETRVVEKKVVVIEPAPVVESLPEKISPIVDPVKPVDSLLEEVSQVFDEIKNEERKDLAVEETPVVVEEQTVVVSETAFKDDLPTSSAAIESISIKNEVEKLPSLDEKASSELKEYVESSMPPKDSISEANAAGGCANETDTVGHSDRQAQAVSAPLSVQKTTSWKSCCGIFDLFSGSERN